jgi:hypothetical protein
MSLPQLTAFTEQVGSALEVMDLSSPFCLKLTKVVEHSRTEHNEAFSVFFLGPIDHFMPQGTRTLRHCPWRKQTLVSNTKPHSITF